MRCNFSIAQPCDHHIIRLGDVLRVLKHIEVLVFDLLSLGTLQAEVDELSRSSNHIVVCVVVVIDSPPASTACIRSKACALSFVSSRPTANACLRQTGGTRKPDRRLAKRDLRYTSHSLRVYAWTRAGTRTACLPLRAQAIVCNGCYSKTEHYYRGVSRCDIQRRALRPWHDVGCW